MKYPDVADVERAEIDALLRWNRFLPSPRTPGEMSVMNAVIERMADLRSRDPVDFSRASRLVGWGR